ncbi:MAG: hypothetical protein QME51_09405, partial [Planctomycetota bacterium]|nr:hypothetical protein [Planctomycetota bacterium]
ITAIAIDYSKDGNNWVYNLLVKDDNQPNGTTTANITVPDAITNTFRIRIRSQDDWSVWSPSGLLNVKGSFLVTLPTDTTIWRVSDTNNEIKWETTGSTIQRVKLDYSLNSGVDNYPYSITSSTPATSSLKAGNVYYGSYIWNTPLPNIVGNNIRVRVKTLDTDWQNAAGESSDFKVRGKLAVTYPDASGITLTVGSKITITWNTTGTVNNVELKLSTDSGDSFPYPPIASGIVNVGKYPADGSGWTVSNNISKQCKIRVESSDHPTDNPKISGISTNNFEIRGKLDVVTPTSTAIWAVGRTETVIWDVTGSVGNVIVEYRRANGTWATDDPIATVDCSNPGTYSTNWIVDDAISSTAKIRIRPILDKADIAESQTFRIKGFIQVAKPDTLGEILRVGDEYTIKWAISGTMNTVTIEWSTNGEGGPWKYINTVSAGLTGGEYNWPVSNTISGDVRIRVYDTQVTDAVGMSPQVMIKGKLILDYPKGNEEGFPWIIGNTYPITWITQGSINSVQIEITYNYSPTGTTTWETITTTPTSPGVNRYDWPTSLETPSSSNVRIRVRNTVDLPDICAVQMSSYSFRIRGNLTLTEPITGTVYTYNDPLTIRWNKSIGITQVKLEWYDPINTKWNTVGSPPIPGGSGTSGSYAWNAPDAISSGVKIRISDWAEPTTINEGPEFRVRG